MEKQFTQNLLNQFLQKLKQEKKKLEKRINELKKDDPFSDPDRVNDNAAVDTDVREQIGHETIEAQILSLQKTLKEVEKAIIKIKKGTYGVCENCQKPIPLARLEIIPYARYCIECERSLRK